MNVLYALLYMFSPFHTPWRTLEHAETGAAPFSGKCLNAALYKGPAWLNQLLQVLIKFRERKNPSLPTTRRCSAASV